MLPFQLNLLVLLRITALSLANPVTLEGLSPAELFPSAFSLSPTDDSISSSSTSDLILSSNHNLVSNTDDTTPALLATAGYDSSWNGGTSSPQQQQQSQDIASCGGSPNRKRAEAGQQLNGAGAGAGGGESNFCDAPLGYTAPAKAGGTTQQTETDTETEQKKKKKEPGEFYNGGGSRPGPTRVFPTDQDVEMQNDMQAAKNRQLQLDDPARCNYSPFFVHTCCDGELGPSKYDEFKGFYYQFVGFCILREFFLSFSAPEITLPLSLLLLGGKREISFFFLLAFFYFIFFKKKLDSQSQRCLHSAAGSML